MAMNDSCEINEEHMDDESKPNLKYSKSSGFYLKTKSELFFIKFEEPCYNLKEYKEALVAQAKRYK